MKTILFLSSLFFLYFTSFGQVNRYTQPPPVSQYNPMSFGDLTQIAQMNAQANKLRAENFSYNLEQAQESYNRRNYKNTIAFCNSALATNLTNSYVYFLRGMSYLNLGFSKEAKKDLKKSEKMGNIDAKLVLMEMKKK